MTWTPSKRSTGLSTNTGHGGGAGRVVHGRGRAKKTEGQVRWEQRFSPVPEGRVRCHVCYRDVRTRKDGTMFGHDYCLAGGLAPEKITN